MWTKGFVQVPRCFVVICVYKTSRYSSQIGLIRSEEKRKWIWASPILPLTPAHYSRTNQGRLRTSDPAVRFTPALFFCTRSWKEAGNEHMKSASCDAHLSCCLILPCSKWDYTYSLAPACCSGEIREDTCFWVLWRTFLPAADALFRQVSHSAGSCVPDDAPVTVTHITTDFMSDCAVVN